MPGRHLLLGSLSTTWRSRTLRAQKNPPVFRPGGWVKSRLDGSPRSLILMRPACLEVSRQQLAVIRIGQLAEDVRRGLCGDPLDAAITKAGINTVTGMDAERLVV